jgi:hypothetical protein
LDCLGWLRARPSRRSIRVTYMNKSIYYGQGVLQFIQSEQRVMGQIKSPDMCFERWLPKDTPNLNFKVFLHLIFAVFYRFRGVTCVHTMQFLVAFDCSAVRPEVVSDAR